MFGIKTAKATLDILKDILKGVKATVLVQVSLLLTFWLLKDFTCKDYICGTLDIIGSVSSLVGIILVNLPATKPLTYYTFGCRLVRYRCKYLGGFWGCKSVIEHGIKESFNFIINKIIINKK